MRFAGLRHLHWYDLVLLPLIALVVYPDRVATWYSETKGRETNWLHAIALSLGALAAAVVFVARIRMTHPELTWQKFGFILAGFGLFRAVMSMIRNLFGFDS
jgi:hypothetical protein